MQSVQPKSYLRNQGQDASLELPAALNLPLINGIIFQIGWFACLIGGYIAAMSTLLIALIVHRKVFVTDNREWFLIIGFAAVGVAVDTLFSLTGAIVFSTGSLLPPIWLVCIWLFFAMSLNHVFIWLHDRLVLAAVLAAIFGPVSYLSGSKIVGASFAEPLWFSLGSIAVVWFFLFPLGLFLARSLSRR